MFCLIYLKAICCWTASKNCPKSCTVSHKMFTVSITWAANTTMPLVNAFVNEMWKFLPFSCYCSQKFFDYTESLLDCWRAPQIAQSIGSVCLDVQFDHIDITWIAVILAIRVISMWSNWYMCVMICSGFNIVARVFQVEDWNLCFSSWWTHWTPCMKLCTMLIHDFVTLLKQ